MSSTDTLAATSADTRTLFRFATAGSVDDGKSTLVGRLLYDAKAILADQLDAVARTSADRGFGDAENGLDLALLTDGLRAGITQRQQVAQLPDAPIATEPAQLLDQLLHQYAVPQERVDGRERVEAPERPSQVERRPRRDGRAGSRSRRTRRAR